LTVHRRAILKVVKSMCNGIKKIKGTLMKCHTNINSTSFTQLPHKFSYIVAILGHNHFESPNILFQVKNILGRVFSLQRNILRVFLGREKFEKKKRIFKYFLIVI
jgi:hypothetical protein